MKTLAAIVGISKEVGLEYTLIKERSTTMYDFREFIQELSKKNKSKHITIFMDNGRTHHAKIVQTEITKHKWNPFFNAPYSASFHCIEEHFNQVKHEYRHLLSRRGFQLNIEEHKAIIN